MITTMRVQTLLAAAVRRSTTIHVQRVRSFHASPSALARQSRRGSRVAKPSATAGTNPFEHFRDDEDEDGDASTKMQKKATFFTQGELDENPDLLSKGADEEGDEGEYDDEETKEFLKDVDELFSLEAKDFGRRLVKIDAEQEELRGTNRRSQADDEDADSDDEDELEEIDRAERIPKKRLLQVLDEFDSRKMRPGKNSESMPVPKTKVAAPLEKKTKKFDPERISHRQERVESSVTDFVQNLLIEDSDMTEADVFAHIVEASVSPDLRRVVLFWEPARRNSVNQTIGKKKAEGVQKRLEKLEKWIRMSVTRHLNMKYSPIIQFKRRKETKNDEVRAVFDQEMAWLERFK